MMVSRCSSMIPLRAPMVELNGPGERLRPYRWPTFKLPIAHTDARLLKGALPLRSSFV